MGIASTAIIYPNVQIGQNVIVEDFCIIGVPIANDPTAKTIIGDNSHIRSHTVIYAGNIIGLNFSTGNKANIRDFNHIGNNVSIGTLTVVEHRCSIEDDVRIHSQAFIPEFSLLKKGCWIGPNVALTNAKYPQSINAKSKLVSPTIGMKAIIGANSTILPGLSIGDYGLIGAGSLVTKDTKENGVYAGSPARFLRFITEIEDYAKYSTV